MSKKTIMIVTTGRADYGLLYPLIKELLPNNGFTLHLIATGTHLAPKHGKTIQLIEQDGIKVTNTIEMTMNNDTEAAICGSISTGLLGFAKLFSITPPDLLIVLGDRYELWPICIAAVIHKIPIAHIHGGEATRGLIDDTIRNSITKMAVFHFATTNLYAKRIIQMGEDPARVFVVGALGLDNIKNLALLTRKELSTATGIDFRQKIALATYHPVTLDNYNDAKKQIQEILITLTQTDLYILFTIPNADTAGNIIYKTIVNYTKQYPKKFKLIKNLGQKRYLSAMRHAQLMIGNSSSGIIESASFGLPVVNIGDRQSGRLKPANVIDCDCSQNAILKAIKKALSSKFKQSITQLKNPYGDGNTAKHIIKILESINLNNKTQFLKKGFYDLKQALSQINLQTII